MLWGFFIFKAKGNTMEDDTTTMHPAAPTDDTMAPAVEETEEEKAARLAEEAGHTAAPEHTEEAV
jgi:hypothetical protein